MYKIAVVGDYDSVYGFGAVGLDTFSVTDPAQCESLIHRLVASYAVIYITENWAAQVRPAIDRYKDQMLPCIIEIPGSHGNTGEGVAKVKKFVETAVGSDIIFGGE